MTHFISASAGNPSATRADMFAFGQTLNLVREACLSVTEEDEEEQTAAALEMGQAQETLMHPGTPGAAAAQGEEPKVGVWNIAAVGGGGAAGGEGSGGGAGRGGDANVLEMLIARLLSSGIAWLLCKCDE